MKTLTTLILTTLFVSVSYAQSKTVYVCTGPSAKTYHSTSECRGLSRCSKEVKSVTLEKAQKMQRRSCRVCCR